MKTKIILIIISTVVTSAISSANPPGNSGDSNRNVNPPGNSGDSNRKVNPPGLMRGRNNPFALGELPGNSGIKNDIDSLDEKYKARALQMINSVDFPAADIHFFRADKNGNVFYEMPDSDEVSDLSNDFPLIELSGSEVFRLHSKPGAAKIVYLDFNGHVLTDTAWNNKVKIDTLYMRPYDSNDNEGSFTQPELNDIYMAWEWLSNSFAPYDIDVTTEEPTDLESPKLIGHILVTSKIDVNGNLIHNANSKGLVYLNASRKGSSAYYQPAMIFTDSNESGGSNSIVSPKFFTEIRLKGTNNFDL